MDHNDIYITNVSMFTTFGSERIRHTEEKTSFDLKNELSRKFEEQGDDWGEIARCYVTKSQGENDGTYIAFMSMKDTRTHVKIAELYNKTMFRGRELIIRISSTKSNYTSPRTRTESAEIAARTSKDPLEEMVRLKKEIEDKIEEETKKRIKEKADFEKEEDWSKRRSELEEARKEMNEREKNVREKEKEIIEKEKKVDGKVKAMKEEWVNESKKLKEEKIRLCHQLFKRESSIRLRELRANVEEMVKGPTTSEEFDVEAARAKKRSTRKSY